MNSPTSSGSAAAFIAATAKLSLLVSALSIAWCLLQWLLVLLLGRLNPLDWLQRQGVWLPPSLQWVLQHALALTMAMLLASLALLAVSWAMLKYREWGRIGFIVLLAVVALANFALLPLVGGMFDALQATLPAGFLATADGQQALAQLQGSRWIVLLGSVLSALLVAALHGWLALKLCRPQVRALFR